MLSSRHHYREYFDLELILVSIEFSDYLVDMTAMFSDFIVLNPTLMIGQNFRAFNVFT